jgi:hypothetical protein
MPFCADHVAALSFYQDLAPKNLGDHPDVYRAISD